MLSEKEFINAIQENKEIIFKVCYMYMNTKTSREDLFQEILLNAWKGIKNFKGKSKFSTWLYSVALNTAITFLKKEQRHSAVYFPETDTYHFNEPDLKNEQLNAMNKAIEQLSDIDKALVMLYLDDFSYQQIADIMGITANNVAVKMNRVKARLKENSNKYL
jgi:RNA polymerase sigma factor (sigma-70 family)